MPDRVPVRRVLISVSDKTDLVPFARALASHGAELISTGGTAKALEAAGLKVTPIDRITGFPEMMDGRVKTLHPAVHGALLALRDHPEHAAAMKAHNIAAIDLVCINLYPFEQTIAKGGVEMKEAIENIDIGGPSMIRSAAKNHDWVAVVTSPAQYDRVVNELNQNEGATTQTLRAGLAASAFARTAEYDAAIAGYLGKLGDGPFPQALKLNYLKVEDLRYGENPHQEAALYRDPVASGPTLVNARQLHGKELSYNNIHDGAGALELALALQRVFPDRIGAAVIKHANPCGAAIVPSSAKDSTRLAVDRAIVGDPIAAYGGILAINAPIDASAATRLCEKDIFLELLIAPDFAPDALAALTTRWQNLRILATGAGAPSAQARLEYRSVPGGMLVQSRDSVTPAPGAWKHAAGPAPSASQLEQAAFAEVVCRFNLSNAVALAGADPQQAGVIRLFGAGSGQVDRVTACRLAVEKAGALAKGSVCASDAFFPFSDGPKILIDAGVTLLLHPGGSKRDQDTFDLCNQRGVTCMISGVRHFRH
jgi:phosphoribosylaminoimidazolecarboxamide formyltransferase/IMP cyclohydrolase